MFNTFLRSANVVFADSQAAAEVGLHLGVSKDKIHIIYPTVGHFLLNSTTSVDRIREKHALQNKRCILTVSRLVERKGHDVLIKALELVLKNVADVHYLIVGTGIMEDNLRELVDKLNLHEHVTFVGFVPDEELGSYYEVCDIFVMVSREIPEKGDIEGFGIVYLEANLLGKPVLAGRSGGVPEAVIDGKTGVLVDPKNPIEVAEALITMLSNPEWTKSLGENGRIRAMRDFSSVEVARRVLGIISDLRKEKS
jgi:phosphatidylinositol alpha-1,6-mannosyltransferase